MRDYVCPECGQPVEMGEPTVIAYSTSYRVHTECGDDTGQAGINPLQVARDRLTDLKVFVGQVDEALKSGWDHDRIMAIWDARATLDQAAPREDDR